MALASVPLSARQLPAELGAAAGPADRAAEYVAVHERLTGANRSPVELTILSKSGAADRAAAIADTTKRAVAMLDAWLGPLQLDHLTIIDAPWNSRMNRETFRGLVVVRSRWMTAGRDRSFERELIAGLSRQYWLEAGRDQDEWVDGVSRYVGGRAIDNLLEGSQFHTDRYLGGFLPFALRAVSLSPQVRDRRPRLRRYEELDPSTAGSARAARALEVAERLLGWPAIQQALQACRERHLRSLAEFVALTSAQRGSDVSPVFGDTVVAGRTIDYAVNSLVSGPVADGAFDVRLTIDRRAEGVFATSLPLQIHFADGTSLRDTWDPVQPHSTLAYTSASPAVAAAIDPDIILVLDDDRRNNVVDVRPQPWNRMALKLACDWTIWLQNLVVTYAGMV